MTQAEKDNSLKRIQEQIAVNQVRLDNAEQNVQTYLENLKILSNELNIIVNEEVNG